MASINDQQNSDDLAVPGPEPVVNSTSIDKETTQLNDSDNKHTTQANENDDQPRPTATQSDDDDTATTDSCEASHYFSGKLDVTEWRTRCRYFDFLKKKALRAESEMTSNALMFITMFMSAYVPCGLLCATILFVCVEYPSLRAQQHSIINSLEGTTVFILLIWLTFGLFSLLPESVIIIVLVTTASVLCQSWIQVCQCYHFQMSTADAFLNDEGVIDLVQKYGMYEDVRQSNVWRSQVIWRI